MSIRSRFIKHVLLPLDEWREGRPRSYLTSKAWSNRSSTMLLFSSRPVLKRCVVFSGTHSTTRASTEGDFRSRAHPDKINDLSDLAALPVLTKADIKGHLGEMVATNISSEGISRSATGGSTGEHTPFYQDLACLNPKIALEYRFNRWASWDVGEPIAFVWPAIQDFAATPSPKRRLRNVLLDRRLMLYSGHLDEQTMAGHSRHLALCTALIRAFANPLWILAKYLKETSGHQFGPRGSSLWVNHSWTAREPCFEEVFGCPVFNCYVSRECGNMAGSVTFIMACTSTRNP